MNESVDWSEIQRKLPLGSLVSCVVTRHEPFGIFGNIPGVRFVGLIQITDFKDEGRMTVDEYPRLGCALTAKVLGFKQTERQIWLGVKPSQVDRA